MGSNDFRKIPRLEKRCRCNTPVYSPDELGSEPGSGIVELYCDVCGKYIESKPMDDLPAHIAESIQRVLEEP